MPTLVVYAHSDPDSSRHNRALLSAASALANVTVHDLTQSYPDFRIDAQREEHLLRAHETVVLQFPMHWYSVPALAKQWFDIALAYGFAYGPGGDGLHGKRFWIASTLSGPADSYGGPGKQPFDVRYDLETFFAFIEQTVRVCGMHWEEPFIVDRVVWGGLSDDELEACARSYAARLSLEPEAAEGAA